MCKTLDVTDDLNPYYKGSVTSIPLKDRVVAFKIFEHAPLDKTPKTLSEMSRIATKK